MGCSSAAAGDESNKVWLKSERRVCPVPSRPMVTLTMSPGQGGPQGDLCHSRGSLWGPSLAAPGEQEQNDGCKENTVYFRFKPKKHSLGFEDTSPAIRNGAETAAPTSHHLPVKPGELLLHSGFRTGLNPNTPCSPSFSISHLIPQAQHPPEHPKGCHSPVTAIRGGQWPGRSCR